MKRVTGASDSDLVLHSSGDTLTVGAVPITLIHTPGHTPGSQCFFVDGRLVAGDTLFLDGCGRTDLPGGDAGRALREHHAEARRRSRRRGAVPRPHVLRPRRTRRWARCAAPTTSSGRARAISGWSCSATTGSDVLAADLAALDFCYVTTTGRTTGQPHRIEIWFAAQPGRDTIFMLSGGRERADWVRNLVASPRCSVEIGDSDVRRLRPRRSRERTTTTILPEHSCTTSTRKATTSRAGAASALPVAIDLTPTD